MSWRSTYAINESVASVNLCPLSLNEDWDYLGSSPEFARNDSQTDRTNGRQRDPIVVDWDQRKISQVRMEMEIQDP